MKKPFQRKVKAKKTDKHSKIKRETSLTDADYNRRKLFKKGINLMGDEKLDDAADVFEQALRIDPKNVETLLKLGYARFHLDDHVEALRVYDRVLDIDVTNAETWNLKSLVHYEQKNYSKALDCTEKAIDSDPTYGMAWYNKACFLSLVNQIPESIEALIRSIELFKQNKKEGDTLSSWIHRVVNGNEDSEIKSIDDFKRVLSPLIVPPTKDQDPDFYSDYGSDGHYHTKTGRGECAA